MQKTSKIIRKIISTIITLSLIFVAYKIYSVNNFNQYIKAEYNSGISKFKRDDEVKYSSVNSYRIENTDYNDAMFFRKISVNPNTPYKITGPAIVKIFTPIPKTCPSFWYSIAGDATEFAKPVIGTRVPAPHHFAKGS